MLKEIPGMKFFCKVDCVEYKMQEHDFVIPASCCPKNIVQKLKYQLVDELRFSEP